MIALLLDHLWQSTLFAAAAGLLTLTLRGNGAKTRFWVWFAASVKFLVPFSVLTMLGGYFLAPVAPVISAPALMVMRPAAQPFSAPMSLPVLAAAQLPQPAHIDIAMLLPALWVLGFCLVAARWARRHLQLTRLLRDAADLPLQAPVPVRIAPSRLEPGLVGIWRPVILLPQGITERLSAAELDAIMAHELCHLRRRDNLLAAIHMAVEALFWFHPLVWWIGRRLNAERERACDESVLASGKSPALYAESILKVCKLYLHSPLACAAGVSGADLKQRLEEIVENKIIHGLKNTRKALLAAAALLAVGAPLALGLVQSAPVLAQAQAPAGGKKSGFVDLSVREVECDNKKPGDCTAAAKPTGKPYAGPMPNKVHMTLTSGERGDNPRALMLRADNCQDIKNNVEHCDGDVALSMPAGIATGDAFTFDVEARKMTLTGKVILFAGMNRMSGTSLVLDASNGVIHMNGQDVKSGYPGMPPVPKTPLPAR